MKNIDLGFARSYIDIYDTTDDYEHYRVEEAGLNDVFKKFPENNKLEQILIKVVLLNKFYSTNIMNPRKVADRIFELQIDNDLKKGDLDLVDKIATNIFKDDEKGEEKIRRFYSFATKYCHKSKPEKYPIYDSNVAYILKAYRNCNKDYFNFTNENLKDYREFKKIIDDFKNYYKLESLNYRELDHFLWIYGKEEQKAKKSNGTKK